MKIDLENRLWFIAFYLSRSLRDSKSQYERTYIENMISIHTNHEVFFSEKVEKKCRNVSYRDKIQISRMVWNKKEKRKSG